MHRTCSQQRDDLTNAIDVLCQTQMVEGYPTPHVEECDSCQSGNWAGCTGPHRVEIKPNDPLVLEPILVKKQLLQVELTQRTIREAGSTAIRDHSVNVKIWKISKDEGRTPVYRAHLDHRVPLTLEPLSHLHLGGCHYSSAAEEEDWDIPKTSGLVRWPVPSADILLVAELLVASCDIDLWALMLDEVPLRQAIRRSEDEYLRTHYVESWLAYDDGPSRSFLEHFYRA